MSGDRHPRGSPRQVDALVEKAVQPGAVIVVQVHQDVDERTLGIGPGVAVRDIAEVGEEQTKQPGVRGIRVEDTGDVQ
ncbi:hypothetical protein [Streptosporangium sp. H16]|uniref:hypothetical protein n=1 Tax=Streptosporangium sp. H16 TaxID=3444184 RepID=UPI003F7B2C33